MPRHETPIIKLASGASVPAAADYAEGQLLQPHPDDAGGELFTCVDVGGTKHWMGAPLDVHVLRSTGAKVANYNAYHSAQLPSWATGVYHDTFECNAQPVAPQDATDRWSISLYYNNVLLISYDLNTLGLTASSYNKIREPIGVVSAVTAPRAVVAGNDLFTLTKHNAPGSLTCYGLAYIVRPIIS